MLDVFNNNAFGVVPLTDAINDLKFVPGYIGRSGLFSTTSVATTSIAIEKKGNILVLVPPSPRGGPGTTVDKAKRTLRNLSVPHFEINDAIMAEEVQGVRAWGQETAAEMVMDKINERNQIHSQSMAATEEFARIGAVKGIVTYADNTTLNLFTEFGVSQESEVAFDLADATPTAGAVRQVCTDIIRLIAKNLDGISFGGVRGVVGDAFFDELLANAEVRSTYLQQQEASQLRGATINGGDSGVYGEFNFGGIVFSNYRGKVGTTDFIATDKGHFYPTGVPGLFRTVYAPADYTETVNTMGKRLYTKQYPMPNGKGVNLDVQMNALQYCTRPIALIKAKKGA